MCLLVSLGGEVSQQVVYVNKYKLVTYGDKVGLIGVVGQKLFFFFFHQSTQNPKDIHGDGEDF